MPNVTRMPISFNMYLIGPFILTDERGVSVAPRSQKAQAILAMLALTRRGTHSRMWLRSKLWSDRAEAQSSASLRQALLQIKRALGPAGNVLQADHFSVHLALEKVKIDINGFRPFELHEELLLEGIGIRDPEFQEWLMSERQRSDLFRQP